MPTDIPIQDISKVQQYRILHHANKINDEGALNHHFFLVAVLMSVGLSVGLSVLSELAFRPTRSDALLGLLGARVLCIRSFSNRFLIKCDE